MAETEKKELRKKRKKKARRSDSSGENRSGSSDDGGESEKVGSLVMERIGRKREKGLKREEEESEDAEQEEEEDLHLHLVLQDPLKVLGTDIMVMRLSNLDARSVALSLIVSRGWHGVASSDRLWTAKCEELWLGKAHIPRLSQFQGLSKLEAYSISVMDGKRIRIMREDLCDHAWEFHFNKAAPAYWRNLDPYWMGTVPLIRRYFHLDGSQSANPDDTVCGGHESCYLIVTSFVGERTIREHYVRINRWPRMFVARKPD